MGMIVQQQLSDGTTRWLNDADLNPELILGGQTVPANNVPRYISDNVIKLGIAAGTDTGGGLVSFLNPFPYAIDIVGTFLDITTVATAACSVECGTTASSGTTASTNLVSSQDIHSATGLFGNRTAFQRLAAGSWVTLSTLSGASAGAVGYLYLEFWPALA